MYLPKQAEPVERSVATEKRGDADGVEPQIDCYCINGTWHCLIGRSIWDTQQPC